MASPARIVSEVGANMALPPCAECCGEGRETGGVRFGLFKRSTHLETDHEAKPAPRRLSVVAGGRFDLVKPRARLRVVLVAERLLVGLPVPSNSLVSLTRTLLGGPPSVASTKSGLWTILFVSSRAVALSKL